MTVLQTWLVVGVPGLIIAAGLFVGRSKLRAWFGYGVLAALIAIFVLAPGGGPSAAIVGLIAVMLIATGRGGATDDLAPEHHEQRRRYTTVREEPENAPAP